MGPLSSLLSPAPSSVAHASKHEVHVEVVGAWKSSTQLERMTYPLIHLGTQDRMAREVYSM